MIHCRKLIPKGEEQMEPVLLALATNNHDDINSSNYHHL